MLRALSLFLLCVGASAAFAASATGSLSTRQSSGAADISRPRSPGLPDPRLGERGSRPTDNIVIVSVQPVKLTPGVRQTVTVRVRYTLLTAPRGVVNIGFNTSNAASFRLVTEKWIDRGTAEVELSADVVPARWPDRPFKAFVNLTTEGNPRKRSSLASDVLPLKLP